jgi:hypothetical protein
MLLSIVVLSYNRPDQIRRILDNLIGVMSDDFNIIIKDDVSPLASEINSIVAEYKEKIGIEVSMHTNDFNVGYDRNLLDAFYITSSDYVFLLSDDDYLIGSKLDELASIIKSKEHDFYFTPYSDKGLVNRKKDAGYSFKNFANVIYNSILFSGLIFNRKRVVSLEKDKDFLSNCIYTQVYLAASIIFEDKSYGFVPEGLLILGGDGENYFGKNQSATNSKILSDRTKITSDLNYQPFLINVVDEIACKTDNKIKILFMREYFKRLVSYSLRVRATGIFPYTQFFNAYMKSKIPFNIVFFISLILLFIVPKLLSKKINSFGLANFRKSG